MYCLRYLRNLQTCKKMRFDDFDGSHTVWTLQTAMNYIRETRLAGRLFKDEVDCKRMLSISAFVSNKTPAGQTHHLTKESPETMFRDFRYGRIIRVYFETHYSENLLKNKGWPVRSATTFCWLWFGSYDVCLIQYSAWASANLPELAWLIGDMVELLNQLTKYSPWTDESPCIGWQINTTTGTPWQGRMSRCLWGAQKGYRRDSHRPPRKRRLWPSCSGGPGRAPGTWTSTRRSTGGPAATPSPTSSRPGLLHEKIRVWVNKKLHKIWS